MLSSQEKPTWTTQRGNLSILPLYFYVIESHYFVCLCCDANKAALSLLSCLLGRSLMRAVVLTDLRIRTILIALSISKLFDSADLLLARATIDNPEYGSQSPSWYKWLKVILLKRMHSLKVVETCPDISLADSPGTLSSLISITHDHKAIPRTYPRIYRALQHQVAGSLSLEAFIKYNAYKEVFVFNGRLASSEPLTNLAGSESDISTWYYEWGTIPHHYTLTKSRIHDIKARSLKTIYLYEHRNLFPWGVDLLEKATSYIDSKLNNRFCKFYKESTDLCFDAAIFLSSPHELLAIDKKFVGDNDLEFVSYILNTLPPNSKIAIRAHPNMRSDPSYGCMIREIDQLSINHQVTIYDPFSPVDSYSLIKNSGFVAVNQSSIAVDAFFIGANLYVHNPNQYKLYIDYCQSAPMPDKLLILAQLCVIESYVDQVPFDVREIVAGKALRLFDDIFVKSE